MRACSRTACRRAAVATLTYVYSDSTAVLGPLAVQAEPHTYDLCVDHAERLTAPRGWQVVRLTPKFVEPADGDDWLALANAVREGAPKAAPPEPTGVVETSRRGHLRMLTTDYGLAERLAE